MKIRKVHGCGWSRDGDSMGTLVDEGILVKSTDYDSLYGSKIIYWTNVSKDVIINYGTTFIPPEGQVIWEG